MEEDFDSPNKAETKETMFMKTESKARQIPKEWSLQTKVKTMISFSRQFQKSILIWWTKER